ncbi:hypothetical protein BCV72DRAFT_254031 [Rhizopus microsporus var. microsporus]|uniref:Uncharacterized protein n=1 Tax=Rhizopus microsporus var. microsporus TaxID=86635 RepID=A0A1X0RG97_RHIZD|nr:hypothetical protein BCV72DRAFT_254031 [Rhizopus microsporus var. microsporus]
MAEKNYFLETLNKWSVKVAFEEIEQNEVVTKATKLLQEWKVIGKQLIPKKDKGTNVNTNTNGGGIPIPQSKQTTISRKPKKKRMYLSIYLSDFYGNTDFGFTNNINLQWIIDEVNMTEALRKFRQVSIEGAQMRKYLFSSHNCVISQMLSRNQRSIMKSINEQNQLTPLNIDATLICHEMRIVLTNNVLTKNEVEDALDKMKSIYNSDIAKTTSKIISDLVTKFLYNSTPNNRKQGEALLIIENIRLYPIHCLVSNIDMIKYDW